MRTAATIIRRTAVDVSVCFDVRTHFLGRTCGRAQRCSARLATAALAGAGAGALALALPAGAGTRVTAVTGPAVAANAASGCATGPYQRQVDSYLKKLRIGTTVKVFGRRPGT